MIWPMFIVLIGGCIATPIQQGSVQFIGYGSQDVIGQNEGIQSPVSWGQEQVEQPIIYVPVPNPHGVKGGSLLTERDQQRHIDVEEDVESREDVSDGELEPQNESRPVSDLRDTIDVKQVDQRPVQTESALLGSSILSVKGGDNQVVSVGENDQVFPQVLSGQRRLVEPQVPQYTIKGRSVPIVSRQNVVYQDVQQGHPLNIGEYRVPTQVVRRPQVVVQYNTRPVQQVWATPQLNQVVSPSGTSVKGVTRNYQYLVHSVVNPSSVNVVRKQPATIIGTLSQVQRRVQNQESVVRNVQEPVQQDFQSLRVSSVEQEVPKVEHLVQSSVKQTGIKSPVQQSGSRVVVQDNSNSRYVPVVSGQRVLVGSTGSGYQLIGSQPQIQSQYSFQTQHQSSRPVLSQKPIQQSVQYVPYIVQLPNSEVPQVYQLVKSNVQQNDDQLESYVPQPQVRGQSLQYSDQTQLEHQLPNLFVVQPEQPEKQVHSVQGIQGVQQIQHQVLNENNPTRSQDIRVNPLSVNQRSQNVGVKGSINV